jgi:hypothetical protein
MLAKHSTLQDGKELAVPQEPVIVYYKENGEPYAMHSVDAQEALRIGDYVATPPQGENIDVAVAMSRMRSVDATVHPELQTPEEREETRRQANEAAIQQAEASGQPIPPAVAAATARSGTPRQETQARGASGRFAAQRAEATTPAPAPSEERK